MSDLMLQYPVHTLDNQQLLAAGTKLTAETIEQLISGYDAKPQSSYLISYKSIKNDILKYFNQTQYSFIFSNQKRLKLLFNLMERVLLPIPILESLDYFKRYDIYTYRHTLMVFTLSSLLALDLVDNYEDLIQEAISGPTHDIGKMCVPLKVLKKNVPLTLSEWHKLKHHTLAGYVLLCYYFKDVTNLAARVARDHHERRDGSGYPSGINITDPMVEIIMVSDIYDALISPRPYRITSFDNRTALEEITKLAEKRKISWEVVQALIGYNRKNQPHYKDCLVSVEKRGNYPVDNLYGVILTEDDNSKNPGK